MSETYEDNYKARDRNHQYRKRMKLRTEKKIKGSIHVFDRLWKRGTRKGTRLAEPQAVWEEEEPLPSPTATTSMEGSNLTSMDNSLHRRHSRRSTSSERPKTPPPAMYVAEETQLDSSSYFGLAGWWRTLRRAHRNAVRAQNLERVVINSRRYRHQASQYYESPFANETRALEALEELEREKKARQDAARKKREMLSTSSKGNSALWWGPFERWRFRDRTVY
jgi:hypothetical protein